MTTAASVLALFLAAVLGSSAAHKLVERARLTRATAGLLRMSPVVAMPLTMAAAAIEAGAALALLFPASRPVGALLAALLWALYGAALLTARRRGDAAIDCGCDFGKPRQGIGAFAVARAFALAAGALALLLSPAGGGGIDVQSILAALAFLALLFAAGEIAGLPATAKPASRRSITR